MKTLFKILNFFRSLRMSGKSYDFKISEGKQFSSGGGFLNVSEPEIIFHITFNNASHIFIMDNPRQINKAIGLKEGIYGNKNSVLLGFSSYHNKFELWLFANSGNGFDHVKIGDFKTDEKLGPFKLGIRKEEYYLEYENQGYTIKREGDEVPEIVGMVRSYFGGQKPNPKGNGIVQIQIDVD